MNIEIANRLYEMRKKKGLSQEELAEKIGVSRQAVSKWERAESSPDIENLILLSQLYCVSLDELLMNEPYTKENTSDKESTIQTDQSNINYKKASNKQNVKRYLICFPIYLVLLLVYLFIGFVWGAWHPGWLLFMLVPIYYMAVSVM